MPIGTLINVATVLVGTLVGALLGNRLPARIRETAFAAIGLTTLLLGFRMGMQTHNILIALGSLVVGGGLGEWWRLDAKLEALGRWVETKVTRPQSATTLTDSAASELQNATAIRDAGVAAQAQPSVARAFVTASLIFCVGPVTVLGAINDGQGDFQLLAIKALLDGIAAVALASSLGWGVGLSAVTVLGFQGGITLVSILAGQASAAYLRGQTVLAGQQALPLGTAMLDEMTAVGGMVIMGLGLLLLDLKQIRIANFLPALALAPTLVLVLRWLGVPIAP